MKKIAVIFAGVLLLTAAGQVSAQAADTKVQQLKAVEVTGSRVVDDIADVPAQTYVVTQEEIAKSGATNVADVLTRVPGVYALENNNGLAFQRSVSVRGYSTEVAVLVDGVPYTDPLHGAGSMGAPNLNTIPIESIERIEVVKGAGSALYGSDAGGGVINIITKKGAEKSSASIKLDAGDGGFFRGTFRGTAVENDWRVTIGASKTVENDDHIYDAYGSKLQSFYGEDYLVRIDKGNWNFSGNFGEGEAKYDKSYDGVYFENMGRKERYTRLNLGYNDGKTLAKAFYNNTVYDYPLDLNTALYPSYHNKYDTKSYGLTFNRKELFDKWKLTWGADVRRDEVDYTDYQNSAADYNLGRTNLAPYFEANVALGEANLDLGLRYDHWNVNRGENEDQLLPRVTLSWANKNDLLFYASAGRFFSMPSFYELIGDGLYVAPNPTLKPEKGWGYELGLKAEKAKNPWSFNLFYSQMDDKIVYDWAGIYNNVNQYKAYGAEGKYTWNINKHWSYAQQLAYTYAEEKASADWTRSRDPRWDIAGFLDYKNNGFTAEINYHYYADRQFTFNSYSYPGADDGNIFLANASLGYKWKNETLRFACTNIFDKRYFTTASGYLGAERRVIFSWQHNF